jgi:hypothetical protein
MGTSAPACQENGNYFAAVFAVEELKKVQLISTQKASKLR